MAYNRDGMEGSVGVSGGGMKEPGELDNRLSLNVNESPWGPIIKEWKDGETYKLSDLGDIDIVQVAPGEFEVVPAKGRKEAATGETSDVAEPEPAEGEYPNPAVRRLMQSEKRQ